MKKINPKGEPDKSIMIRLSSEERSRFKTFCKYMGFNYSDMFRVMANEYITRESIKLGLKIKCFEPQIIFNDQQTNKQLDLWIK